MFFSLGLVVLAYLSATTVATTETTSHLYNYAYYYDNILLKAHEVGQVRVKHMDDCHQRCKAKPLCGGFTWSTAAEGTCLLKKPTAEMMVQKGTTSVRYIKKRNDPLDVFLNTELIGIPYKTGLSLSSRACIQQCQSTEKCVGATMYVSYSNNCTLLATYDASLGTTGTSSFVKPSKITYLW